MERCLKRLKVNAELFATKRRSLQQLQKHTTSQISAEDVVKTQEIASLRIHIERAINKIENFLIWDRVVPATSSRSCKIKRGKFLLVVLMHSQTSHLLIHECELFISKNC